jgi:DNA-binding transcriptional LysR family regulator
MRDSSSTRFIRFHLKTRHLVLLVELGRHASILHAAEAAGLTQPGASKLIGELEHALGVPLFERLPRGVVPTWYGQVLIRRAGAASAAAWPSAACARRRQPCCRRRSGC